MKTLGRTSTEKLLISFIIILSASTVTSSADRKQSTVISPEEVNISLPVLVDTTAELYCPPVLWTTVVVATWEIVLRDKAPCFRAYRADTNETTSGNCTDERIIWSSRLDQNPALQIGPVAVTHDGYYRCQKVAPNGNFHRGYHLQVLVPPEVTLVQSENGTVVCMAVAGKPAAQISWTPEGDCVTEQNPHWGNGTVTVRSMCYWKARHVPNVSCTVSHVTGNKSLFLELNQGAGILGFPASYLLIILYVKFPLFLVILVIVGFLYFQRTGDRRSHKEPRTLVAHSGESKRGRRLQAGAAVVGWMTSLIFEGFLGFHGSHRPWRGSRSPPL
ncbi:cell surface glycoprotein CD200 receptor 1-like isoform X1 [Phacochoerus africanus]|uniref:cell surface glycoprotein CD200 receptor 1-like isoform X1 n=1 Tax=Phacochoerus africanus TaxID=41426 RepID=UPI001FD8CC9C|nr:cell surface glycoprotein CD200 receptor 1-like isoform X1 [Phacochoerus africanus]